MSLSPSDALLFGAIAVLATNHVLTRLPGWTERRWLFWLVQILNLLVGSWMFGVGVPDLKSTADIANKMLGLLFFFHIVTNNLRLQKQQRRLRQQTDQGEDQQRARIRAAMQAAETTAEDIAINSEP